MMTTSRIDGITLPNVYRDGPTVKVDTWGGEGILIDEDGAERKVSKLNGTLTLHYLEDQDAVEAEEILRRWSSVNAPLRVEADLDWANVRLTNLDTGEVVGTR